VSESPNQPDVPQPEEETLPFVPIPDWDRAGETRGAVPVLRPGDDEMPPGKPGARWEAAGLRGEMESRKRSVRRAARRVIIGAAACLVLVIVVVVVLRDRAADEIPAGYQPGGLPAETRVAMIDSELAKMEKALREQEDRLEEKRKVLNTIVETKGIVYKGGSSVFGGAPVGADEDMVARSKREREQAAVKTGIDTYDFVEARRDFEHTREIHDRMRIEMLGRRLELERQRAELDPGSRTGSGRVALTGTNPNPGLQKGAEVVIGGYVRKPGQLALRDGMTLGEAVESAAGASEFGATNRMELFRDGKRRVIDLRTNDGRTLRLKPGDNINVPQKNWLGDGGGHKQPAPAVAAAAGDRPEMDKRASGEDRVASRESAQRDPAKPQSAVKRLNESLNTERLLASRDAVPVSALSHDSHDFVDARGDFEQAREMFDQMRIKYQGERIQLELPRNPIIIHEEASVVRKPSWYSIDRRSESRAVVQVNPRTPDMQVFGGHYSETSGAGLMTKQFFGTEFEVLKAQKTLEPVVEELRLDKKWGISKEQALRRLQDSVETKNVRGTDLIEIRAKDADPILSRDIASGVAKAYRDRRARLEEERAQQALDKLNNALREQEDRVEEKRKLLNTIVETKAIVYRGGESIFGGAPVIGEGGTEGEGQVRPPLRERMNDAIDLMAEVSATDQSFSTFSLHVSDASFRVAAAALARGERPDPETVRPEEFYNAFDYGDPAPTAGEAVGCAIEQCAHPLLPSRNLVRIGVRTAAEGRGDGQALRLTVLLDSSGSMEREDRRAAVDMAMGQLVSLLGPRDVITVIGFSRRPRLLVDRMDGDAAQRELAGLVRQIPAEGGTNLEWALELADDLATRQFDAAAQNRIVLLTDGAANLGNADPEELAKRVEGLRQRGVSFDAAGFGTAGMNDRMLERLTRDGNGRYYVVDGPEDADEQFARKLAGAFRPAAENVKVQVRFNPARVASYRLIGFEEHRLKKEDFRDDSVDAAEMASEEAGVAVYQVELLPDGEGEIGEVSVRFRDAAKGRMVERSWTMPHDASAPGFDRASGSMQVAGLAVLAADALRDGPLAPLIDWSKLAPVTNQVRAEFGGSEKVGQLLQMVERLR